MNTPLVRKAPGRAWPRLLLVTALAGITACQRNEPPAPEPAPEPAVTETAETGEATETSTPAPAPPGTPEPTPEATPAPAPTADPLAVLRGLPPEMVPRHTVLTAPATFPAMMNGRQVGTVQVPAGTAVRVVAIRADGVEVAHGSKSAVLAFAGTDILRRLPAAETSGAVLPPVAARAPAPETAVAVAAAPRAAAVSTGPLLNRLDLEVVRRKITRVEGGDYDDKRDRISLTVRISNQDTREAFAPMQATIWIFGKSITGNDLFRVLATERFEVPALAPRGPVFEFNTRECVTGWDNTNGRWGERYSDWILRLTDAAGKEILVKSTSPSFAKHRARFEALKVDGYCDRNLDAQAAPVNARIYQY